MGIFDNYENLNPDYIPDNSSEKPSDERRCLNEKLPRKTFNVKGNFVGYRWSYGDIFDLTFSVNKQIAVYSDSIVYDVSGAFPSTTTVGKISQQAYNIVDLKSWTCVGINEDVYIWVEDECVSYPVNGDKYIDFVPNMKNKTLKVELYNFRWESIKTFTQTGQNEIVVSVDKDTSEELKPGVYYCLVKVQGDEDTAVKQKTMFIID